MGISTSVDNIDMLKKENTELKQKIDDQNNQLLKYMQIIQLLKGKDASKFCVKNGIVCNINQNISDEITKCKKNKDYEYIVFSGGGIKGIAFCGAINMLNEYHILYDDNGRLKIKGFGGTSAGSIMAAMLAIGYTPCELKEIMMRLNTENLLDDKWGIIRDAINFVDDYGVAPGKMFYDFLGDYIRLKTGDADYTIDQLYKDKGIKLVIVGTNMNSKSSIYFFPNHHDVKYYDIPIRMAVRISMSIPFIFEPFHF